MEFSGTNTMTPAVPPFASRQDHPRIHVVGSFEALVMTTFGGGAGIHALCWRRTLAGDFSEIVEKAGRGEVVKGLLA